jgi:hypothetical protein
MAINTIHVHPPSGITSWGGWPDDVRETLIDWNSKRDLTFRYLDGRTIFQCEGCLGWHMPGATVAVYKGEAYCDFCMITIARASDQ